MEVYFARATQEAELRIFVDFSGCGGEVVDDDVVAAQSSVGRFGRKFEF